MEAASGSVEGVETEKRARRGLRLTKRDRQLLGVLATARYLSSEQIHRLFFAGRTEAACRGRLFTLGGLGRKEDFPFFVERLRFRSFEGRWYSVWTPTVHGYCIARDVLGVEVKVPPYEVSTNFLEHSVRLNDLLVSLLDTGDKRVPAARHTRFRWVASDSGRLPWREYDPKKGAAVERIIQPDAILEIPGLRQRFFLECEMGTQTIITADPEKHGATSNKLKRYHLFAGTYVDINCTKTYYQEAFPDRWPPELLFLVNSAVRRDHVAKAIEKADSLWGDRFLRARALTFEEAQLRLRKLVETADPQALEPEPVAPLSKRDFAKLGAFYNASIASLKRARAQVRELKMPQLKLPDYPPNSEKVADVLNRLNSVFRPKNRPAA